MESVIFFTGTVLFVISWMSSMQLTKYLESHHPKVLNSLKLTKDNLPVNLDKLPIWMRLDSGKVLVFMFTSKCNNDSKVLFFKIIVFISTICFIIALVFYFLYMQQSYDFV